MHYIINIYSNICYKNSRWAFNLTKNTLTIILIMIFAITRTINRRIKIMSDVEMSKQLQDQINRLQQTRMQLQMITQQRQQIELRLRDIEEALKELEKQMKKHPYIKA